MKNFVAVFKKYLVLGLGLWFGLVLSAENAHAVQSARLTWTPSNDPQVAGYRIYYGGASQYYTNFVTVGNVTNTVITGLADGVTYYFSAKSYDNSGDESDFSNEASISSTAVAPNSAVHLLVSSLVNTNNRYTFSLADGTPAGVTLDPATGELSWLPGQAYASTTNYLKVIVSDNQNPGSSMIATLIVAVGDSVELNLDHAVLLAGQSAALPLIVASSAGLTNLSFNVSWPGATLTNAQLVLNDSNAVGQLIDQGTNLTIQINTPIAAGSNTIGYLSFQSLPGQDSVTLPLSLSHPLATKPDATAYANLYLDPASITIVGQHPLLALARTDANGNLPLTIYATPATNYEIQYCTNLTTPAAWIPLVDYSQTNLAQTVNLPAAQPSVFYRLVQP